jgi:uncharacterized protein YndB with AHSA1/START domain
MVAKSNPGDDWLKLTVTRRYSASAELVFDAWLNPEHARHWLFATPGGKRTRVEIDARVGGRFVIVEQRGTEEAYHSGEYLKIDRPRHLIFSFGVDEALTDAARVEIIITPLSSGCELTLNQAMHPKFLEYFEPTKKGWTTLLNNLDQLLATSKK